VWLIGEQVDKLTSCKYWLLCLRLAACGLRQAPERNFLHVDNESHGCMHRESFGNLGSCLIRAMSLVEMVGSIDITEASWLLSVCVEKTASTVTSTTTTKYSVECSMSDRACDSLVALTNATQSPIMYASSDHCIR
jgi:hypothetical protein